MLDSTVKTVAQVHRVWEMVAFTVSYDSTARNYFINAITARRALESYEKSERGWGWTLAKLVDSFYSEFDRLDKEYKANAKDLQGIVYNIVTYQMCETIDLDTVHDILAAFIWQFLQ